jgi:hypothetical protein
MLPTDPSPMLLTSTRVAGPPPPGMRSMQGCETPRDESIEEVAAYNAVDALS